MSLPTNNLKGALRHLKRIIGWKKFYFCFTLIQIYN